MYNKKIPVNLDCGLALFKEVLDGKYKIQLIYYIYSGINRPGALIRKVKNADRRVIENQLKELTEHGLITKKTFDIKPPKVEYELTELGKSLIPTLTSINEWGESHKENLKKNIQSRNAQPLLLVI